MPYLGQPVEYRPHAEHAALYDVPAVAGLITSINTNGTYGLVVFPPNREPRSVDSVAYGDGAHEFVSAGASEPPPPLSTSSPTPNPAT